ncbi:UNVERIFIED_ORG: P pilus assembly chaperone PapD [Citrobacter freundii]
MLGLSANAEQIKVDTLKYGVVIEGSRVIYPSNSTGETLVVVNPQTYPVLVQTKILSENKDKKAPFFVTPPLFRLDGTQRYSLRITKTGEVEENKESLYWACVKGIPPKADDLWAKDVNDNSQSNGGIGVKLNISIDNCIKLIVRPKNLKNNMLEHAENIVWHKSGKDLIARNNSSFYMNIGSLEFNGVKLTPSYIPPEGERRFTLNDKSDTKGVVAWSVIDDYGALSKTYSKKLN